jgi:hypothetical protein
MRKITFLRAALCLVAAVMLFMVGSRNAAAQPVALCQPCPDWWVSYEYIWPPCDTVVDPVRVEVGWANGLISIVSSNTDGHIIYPTPHPISQAVWVKVNGINIPIGGGKVLIQYTCNGAPMCLEVEVRCNPCLEIKIKLVPGPC